MAKPPLSATGQAIRPAVFADLQPHIDAHLARGGDLIPLQIGDTYLDPPQSARLGAVIEQHGADEGLYRYGPCAGLPDVRAAIADELRGRRTFPDVSGASILLGTGATHALYCAARSVLDPGDDVLLAAPYWPLAPGILAACGARAVEVPFTSRLYEDPRLDAGDLFRAAATSRTKALYLISPNNPDGKVLSRDHLKAIAAFAEERDLWVISDEVYADFTFGPPHISIASLPGMADRTITAYSFSKSHALAGARVGYVVANEDVVRTGIRVSTHSAYHVPTILQRVAAAALSAGPRWLERAALIYKNALEATVDALRGSPVRFSVAEGGTYLFLDFRQVLGDRPLSALLERAIERGVLLAPGVAFGASYAQWARLCFTAVPLPRLLEGVSRLRGAMRSVQGERP